MKKQNRIQIFIFSVFVSVFVLTRNVQAENIQQPNHNTQSNLTIAIASDLHLDPENQYGGVVNPLVLYNMDIIDAMLYDVVKQQADILLLCGDITNSGRVKQHEALTTKLRTAEEQGVKIYVLPGNHDIGEGEAELFVSYYEDFGFSEAYSRDTDSLSYSVILGDLMILMLDTDGYSRRTGGAYVSNATLSWIEEQLQLAADQNLQVLTAGHYSLLTGQSTEFVGQDSLAALLEKYRVPLYICGHLHQRNVTSGNHLTELVVEQVLSYPCGYALLHQEGENEYHYSSRAIDVTAWAKATGQTNPELLNFNEYEEKVSRERSRETVEALKGNQKTSKKKIEQATEFLWSIQQEYLQGTLYDHKKEIEKDPGYKAFMKLADGTTYGRWIPVFLEKAGPYTAGFYLKDNQLTISH